MPARDAIVLDTAIGHYPHTAALIDGRLDSPLVSMRFADLPAANRAFAPMVRSLRYHVSEMAIATLFQAKSIGVPIVLLPVVLAARFQEGALLCRATGPVRRASDLKGERIGVRSYSQTTAMWLRGILADGYSVAASDVEWLTFEDAHVAGIADPANARRAGPDRDLIGALRAGTVDAIIVGNDVPNASDLRSVFTDPAEAAGSFWRRYGIVPVNHLLTMRADLAAERPDVAAEIVRLFRAAYAERTANDTDIEAFPISRDRIEAAVSLALRFAAAQDMLPNPLDEAGVWAGTPDRVWEAT